jgi:hypothetical protein
MSEEKKTLLKRVTSRRQNVQKKTDEQEAEQRRLESLMRRVIREEMKELPRNADDLALVAVAKAVKDITPELQMDARDIAEFLNPEHRYKRYLALQGDDVNRQVLVEVADLHLAISALEKTVTTYDENRREDGHFLAGHVVNAVREEFEEEREKLEETAFDSRKSSKEKSAEQNKPDYSIIVIPLLITTIFNVFLMLVLFLLLR